MKPKALTAPADTVTQSTQSDLVPSTNQYWHLDPVFGTSASFALQPETNASWVLGDANGSLTDPSILLLNTYTWPGNPDGRQRWNLFKVSPGAKSGSEPERSPSVTAECVVPQAPPRPLLRDIR